MEKDYNFLAPVSRVYKTNQSKIVSLTSARKFDGGILVAAEVAKNGASILSKIMSAVSQHKREERKLRSQLRGIGNALESDILAKIEYGMNMLSRIGEFYEFLDRSARRPSGAFVFELADRIRRILELDDSFDYSKTNAAWDAQKDFLFKHGKDRLVRRIAAFYNMIAPKMVQIEQEKSKVFEHFRAFLEDLEQGGGQNADEPSEHALFRMYKTLESLEKLADLYIDVTLRSFECLTG